MKRFWAALGFLTVVPLPTACRHAQEDLLVQSVPFFPLVGLLIGLSAAAMAALLDGFFPPLVLAVMLAGWMAAAHGGLHLDGLADTADGFFSHSGRERILEIMHDSRIGAFGCLAIVGLLSAKAAALTSLPEAHRIAAALLSPLAGRCIMVPMLGLLPAARPAGLGLFFSRQRSGRESIWAVAFLVGSAWLAAGTAGLIAAAAVMAAASAFAWMCRRKIGGTTGDTIGAASEIAETVMLLALCAQPIELLWG